MPQQPSEKQRAQFVHQLFAAMPHFKALGMELGEIGAGRAEISMAYDVRFIGDPETGVISGGAVSALMDTSSGAAVMCHPTASLGTATLGLRIDYMRAATPGQRIRAHAECYHVTRNVAFVRATATDDDAANPVATATATFTIQRELETKS